MDLEDQAHPRIGILVVAYNAAATLHRVLDRIPEEGVRPTSILVSDDASRTPPPVASATRALTSCP